MSRKSAIVTVKHQGKYIRPAVKQYQTVEDFMSCRDLTNFKRYLLSTGESDPAEVNPNDDNQRQKLEQSSSNNRKTVRQENETQRMNRLMKVRHDIDVAFLGHVSGNQQLPMPITEYQKQLQREVMIRHSIQYLSEEHAKFLNSCLLRYNKDKNTFLQSTLSLKLSTTVISVWYDKAVEMFDWRAPKFISTNDVLLKVQGWKRCTREQMQQERDSVIKQLVRGCSTEKEVNTSGESSSQSKVIVASSSSSPELRDESLMDLLKRTGDIIPFKKAEIKQNQPEPKKKKPEKPIIELLEDLLVPMLKSTNSTSTNQNKFPCIGGFRKSIAKISHKEKTHNDFGIEILNQNMPSTSQTGQEGSSNSSFMLAQHQPTLQKRPSISYAPCSYIPKFNQPAHQENHFGQMHIQQNFNEASQNTSATMTTESEPGVMLKEVKIEPEEFNNFAELVEPRPEPEDNYPYAWKQNQRRYDSNLQNENFQKDNKNLGDAPYNPFHQGISQNHHHNNIGVSMAENNAGFLAPNQHQPHVVPQVFASSGYTQQPLVPSPQMTQSHTPRGERKLPEAMTLILPDSQKTDCNDWTEEDCRNWIEKLGFENREDLEYLRGKRFNKFDFLFLVQSEYSRETVFNMPRPVYSALVCCFNKVLNMHNGHN